MKNKIGLFALGLFTGLTIGVVFGVAIKEVLAHLNSLHSTLMEIGTRQGQISQQLDSIEGKISKKNKEIRMQNAEYRTQHPETHKIDSGQVSSGQISKLTAPDSSRKAITNKDTITLNDPAADSNVVVMTNQLITVSNVSVSHLDSSMGNKSTRKADSAIATLSEINGATDNDSFHIEFWESPINFKGYKMSQNKLILYGINPTSQIKMAALDGAFYLLVDKTAYLVDYTDDFRPFDKVEDKSVLKKLKIES